MLKANTNFACLMDLVCLKSKHICEKTGADKALVSRWRSGSRRLVPGNQWVEAVADCFLEADAALLRPVIPELLHAYYPFKALDTAEQRRSALILWLTSASYKRSEYSKEHTGLTGLIMNKMQALEASPVQSVEPEDMPFEDNTVVYGIRGAQGCTLHAAEIVLNMTEPQDILFICPEGLDIYTRDPKFGPKLMDMLMQMFAAGHRMSVVLRTDYKMTDVSAFSGRWLVAHLLGYIKSYYFDEFHKTYTDKMMAVVGGHMAYKVRDVGEGVFTTMHFDTATVESIRAECEVYRQKSKQRFHYSFFEHPDGFLHGIRPLTDRVHYQFARLPHFCLSESDTFKENFNLTDDEMTLLGEEFALLLFNPAELEPDARAYHIFCEDDIENALLKSRHVSQELSAITGRRVNMNTQRLAEQLTRIKSLLTGHPGYEVCFLPDSAFQKLTMQIAAWGDRAAVGWIAGGKSTACCDYTNTNALTGFCGMVWEHIPSALRTRRMALRKLNLWLKKARKYDLDV